MAGVGMATVAARLPRCRWGRAPISFGFHRGVSALLAQNPEWAPRGLPGQCPKGGSRTRSLEHPGFRPSLSRVSGAPFRNALPPSRDPGSVLSRRFWRGR